VEFGTAPVMVVQPNPADDVVQVSTGIASVRLVSWSIISITGEEHLSCRPTGDESAAQTINVSTLPAGRYVLRLMTTHGMVYLPLAIQR
jgi:hypothetical protein